MSSFLAARCIQAGNRLEQNTEAQVKCSQEVKGFKDRLLANLMVGTNYQSGPYEAAAMALVPYNGGTLLQATESIDVVLYSGETRSQPLDTSNWVADAQKGLDAVRDHFAAVDAAASPKQ